MMLDDDHPPLTTNAQDTLVWCRENSGARVQFTQRSAREYLEDVERATARHRRRARRARRQAASAGVSALVLLPVALLVGVPAVVGSLPFLVAVLAVLTCVALLLSSLYNILVCHEWAEQEASKELSGLRREAGVVTVMVRNDPEAEDRGDFSPVTRTLDRITQEMRDDLTALFRSGERQAMNDVLVSLVGREWAEQERARLEALAAERSRVASLAEKTLARAENFR